MWQTITSNAGQSSHHQPGSALSIAAGVNSYMPVQYKEESCSLQHSVSAAMKNVQQDVILESGAYGLKIAGIHNGTDGGMFESMEEMNGNLCPGGIRTDGQNMYLSSPCSSTDSASSFGEHRPLDQNNTAVRDLFLFSELTFRSLQFVLFCYSALQNCCHPC